MSPRATGLGAVGVATLLATATACAAPPRPTFPDVGATGVLEGSCEASAAVLLDGRLVVGDNEVEDHLLVYDLGAAPTPAGTRPLAEPVGDLEALAVDADGAAWAVGSQSVNRKGERKPKRERVLGPGGVVPLDLAACAACEAARGKRPGDGGLDVEGAAFWHGALWLGLRGPRVDGRTLLLRTVDGSVEAVVPLDVAGGVRELVPWKGGLLVIVGPSDDTPAPHRLVWLATPDAEPTPLTATLPAFAEGLVVLDDGRALWVSDGQGDPGACTTPSRWGVVQLSLP